MRHKHPMNATRQRRKFTRKPSGGGRDETGGNRGNANTRYHGEEDGQERGGVSPRQRQHAKNAREKYLNMARDAASSGDRVQAEFYYQHADHYARILSAAQEQYEARHRESHEDHDADSAEDDAGEAAEAEHSDRNVLGTILPTAH